MLISITVCLYNSRPYIKETLDSVFAQTYQDFELILVDDGSKDGCADYIESLYDDPRIKLFRKQNEGLGPTRNFSMAKATGEYIAFLDHDDVWLPTKLEAQVAAIRAAPRPPAIVFCDYVNIDSQSQIMDPRGSFARNHWAFTDDLFETLMINGIVLGLSTAMVRRSAVEKGILFRPFRIAEDYDYWLRVAFDDPSYAKVNDVLCHYRIHASSQTILHKEDRYTEVLRIIEEWSPKLRLSRYAHLLPWFHAYEVLLYGHWLFERGKRRDAVAQMLKAVRLCPGKKLVWRGLARVLVKPVPQMNAQQA